MQYFGGKARISKQIAEYINSLNGHNYYVEPFCGACNVASKVNIPIKILNDKHPYLIEMFKALQNGWVPPTTITEEEYRYIKDNLDEDKALSGFVGFGCSFAGKWFGGYAKSNSRNYCLNAYNSILNKMSALKEHVTFTNYDFRDIHPQNALIYCDIPYKNTTPYCKKILGEFPYDKFLQWTKEKSKNNIVLISEYKKNLPDNAKIVLEIPSKTDIRNKQSERIPTTEILFTFNNL